MTEETQLQARRGELDSVNPVGAPVGCKQSLYLPAPVIATDDTSKLPLLRLCAPTVMPDAILAVLHEFEDEMMRNVLPTVNADPVIW